MIFRVLDLEHVIVVPDLPPRVEVHNQKRDPAREVYHGLENRQRARDGGYILHHSKNRVEEVELGWMGVF